jgi:hypothetical protein
MHGAISDAINKIRLWRYLSIDDPPRRRHLRLTGWERSRRAYEVSDDMKPEFKITYLREAVGVCTYWRVEIGKPFNACYLVTTYASSNLLYIKKAATGRRVNLKESSIEAIRSAIATKLKEMASC